jgi:hypothetical protein
LRKSRYSLHNQKEIAMKRIMTLALLATSAALAGCGEKEGEGGVTAEEAQALNEAEDMLDTSPDSLVASNEVELGNGDEPILPEAEDEILNNSATSIAQ